jgi:hypothetical protein
VEVVREVLVEVEFN